MDIYLLPGLGADERIFQYLDLSGHKVIPIKWSKPAKKEPIGSYAAKIASQITSKDAVLIGMSFGGMMSIEIGKIIPLKKIIIISSCVNYLELPAFYRLAGKLKIQRLLTGGLLKRSHRLMNWVMSAKDPIRKNLLADMLRDTDEDFLHWALDKTVSWKNTTTPENVSRIHGDRDRVLPLRRSDFIVKNGGHIMVATHPAEVSRLIASILDTCNR